MYILTFDTDLMPSPRDLYMYLTCELKFTNSVVIFSLL